MHIKDYVLSDKDSLLLNTLLSKEHSWKRQFHSTSKQGGQGHTTLKKTSAMYKTLSHKSSKHTGGHECSKPNMSSLQAHQWRQAVCLFALSSYRRYVSNATVIATFARNELYLLGRIFKTLLQWFRAATSAQHSIENTHASLAQIKRHGRAQWKMSIR